MVLSTIGGWGRERLRCLPGAVQRACGQRCARPMHDLRFRRRRWGQGFGRQACRCIACACRPAWLPHTASACRPVLPQASHRLARLSGAPARPAARTTCTNCTCASLAARVRSSPRAAAAYAHAHAQCALVSTGRARQGGAAGSPGLASQRSPWAPCFAPCRSADELVYCMAVLASAVRAGRTRLLYRMSLDFLHWTKAVPGIGKFWEKIAGQVGAGRRPSPARSPWAGAPRPGLVPRALGWCPAPCPRGVRLAQFSGGVALTARGRGASRAAVAVRSRARVTPRRVSHGRQRRALPCRLRCRCLERTWCWCRASRTA